MESKRQLTREELLEMESAPKTKMQHMLDVVICFCPYFAAIIMFLVYHKFSIDSINVLEI